jgi:hypothetical protein
VFCFLDVLLRCMYGRFYGDLIFSDFVFEDRGFSDFRFFQSWASSCIDMIYCCCCNSQVETAVSTSQSITVYSIRL